ncbi:MAG TPA: MFS transporter, partial [bacterium]|nr:MFS transporter [bacterium]
MSSPASPVVHPRAAFQSRDFRYFISARFLAWSSHQMMNVALGQWIYEWTRDPIYLGYLGLALFVPKIAFTIFAGHVADRFDRRRVILICRIFQFLAVVGLALVAGLDVKSLVGIYALVFLTGTANSFDGPSSQAIVPQLVPPDHFSNAVKWNSSIFQLGFIAGPMLAGWLYAWFGRVEEVLFVVAGMRLASCLLVAAMRYRSVIIEKSVMNWNTLMAGLRFIMEKRVILGTISLDLFAVLLGGAVALLPVYANDILGVGAEGLGILRAAPAVGAGLTAVALAYLPPMRRAGSTMLVCVGLFGVFIILFGISTNFDFSIFCLFLLGAADMVSVVIRGVLVQVKTPNEMRGRVSAVNLIFIGASNELGEFESGLTAAWFGTVPAVV